MADSQASAPKSDAPSISVLTQYIKDMSFENPNAPMSLAPQQQAPAIAVNVNVNARALSETDYEVELVLVGQAGEAPQLLFQMELTYCGIFRLQNIPAEPLYRSDRLCRSVSRAPAGIGQSGSCQQGSCR